MVKILRKPGWILNPNDKIVNAILSRCEKNDGHCPCHNEGYDTKCPCSDYREEDKCHCGLYIQKEILKPVVNMQPDPLVKQVAYA